jgi:hypothetical protein
MSMHRRSFVAGLAAATLLPRVGARAAPTPIATDIAGKWLDLAIDSENLGAAKRLAPDARDREKFFANVDAFVAVLKKHSAWRTPMGFDVKPTLAFANAWSVPRPAPAPIPGMLLIHCFWYHRYDGKPVRDDESPLRQQVFFNIPESIFSSSDHVAEDADGNMYRTPTSLPTHVDNLRFATCAVVTNRTQPPIVPVSRKRLATAWLAQARHSLGHDDKRGAAEVDRLGRQLADLTDPDVQAIAALGKRELAATADDKAWPIGAENPSFLDPKLPRTALQIAVMPWAYAGSVTAPAVIAVRDALIKGQAWPKLHEVLA